MAVPVYLSGVNASVRTPGVPEILHSFAEWEVQGTTGTPNVTNFRTAPWRALLTGVFQATITLRGPKDSSGDDNWVLAGNIIVDLYWDDSLHLHYLGVIAGYRLSQNVNEHGVQEITVETTGTGSVALETDGIPTVVGAAGPDQTEGEGAQAEGKGRRRREREEATA